jgi:uroporphyrinogen-III synthase
MNEDMDPVSQLSQQLSTSYPSVVLKKDEKVCNTFDSMIVLLNSNDSNDDYSQEINSKNIQNLNVMQLSPIEFNFINTKQLFEALINVDFWSALCITSKRCIDAIEYTINTMTDSTIDNNIIDLWKNKNKTIFVVGEKSKDYLLKRLNWESIGSHCGSAQMLAQFIIDNYKHQFINKQILFPCSSLRNDSLPIILRKAEINVNEIIVYETIPNRNLDSDIVKLNCYITDCLEKSVLKFLKLYLVFFSPSGLNSVYPLLLKHILSNDQIKDKLELKYIAFGALTASALQQSGLSVWFTSPKPNPKSLAQALCENLNLE